MTTLPNMGIILPVLGGDSGSWDDKLNAGLVVLDAHDHSAGKGARIKTNGINIDADLAFNGFGATTLGRAAFSAVAALAAGSKTLFVNAADNELYWRTNAGVNVKLTSGTSINTSLIGGIGGDYASVGADLDYDDANKRYTFRTQTGTWARIASGPIRIYEYNTTEVVYLELAIAAGLASSYTLTFPAALPASPAVMRVSAAGVVSFDLTTPTTIRIQAAEASANVPHSAATPSYGGSSWFIGVGDNETIHYPIRLPVGSTITSWSLKCYKQTSGATTLDARLWKKTGAGIAAVETQIGATQQNNAAAPTSISLGQSGLTALVSAGDVYFVRCSSDAVGAGDSFDDMDITATVPV